MAEYIEREAYCAYLKSRTAEFLDDYGKGWSNGIISARRIALKFPAADVAPVVHGRWDDSGRYTFPGGGTAVRCTECGCALTVSEYHLNNWNYCPVCGAKMDGERKDGGDS